MTVVSVIIPTYNCDCFLTEAIESILRQQYRAVEIVVVDDGSTDNTRKTLRPYIDEGKIRYIYQRNQGPGSARNRGIRESSGDYIAFLDADDALTPESIGRRINFLGMHPFLDMVFSDFYMEASRSELPGEGFLRSRGFLQEFSDMIERKSAEGILFQKELYQSFFRLPFLIWTGTVLARRSLIDKIGLFRTDISAHEDTDMWFRMVKKGRIAYVDEPLAYYKNFRSKITKDTLRYAQHRYKFYSSLLTEFKGDKIIMNYVRRRIGWIYFDLGKHYQWENRNMKAAGQFIKSVFYDPGNALFYKALASVIVCHRVTKIFRPASRETD